MFQVTLPPDRVLREDGSKDAGWWHAVEDDDRIACDLCPRDCRLKPGDRGFCFVRENRDGQMILSTYGRSTGFCIDPIEKKPLNHFYPGTSVLSFGTAGCNLGCKFCQNWDISKSREVERLSELATPEAIAQAAQKTGCHSVAFTYNDPVIWAEYAIDVAAACHELNIKTVAVTAGYITDVARAPFFQTMDAANVDLKAFTEDFYYRLTMSHLEPVLESLRWLKHESDVWFEITNLIIPRSNDSTDELQRMCDWVLENVGDEVPIHFTAFHPDFRMQDVPRTPHETLLAAHDIARRKGIKYVYTGNVHDVAHQSTYCGHCGELLIERDWHQLGAYHLNGSCCGHCGGEIAGRFDAQPGSWGRRRLPVNISQYSQPIQIQSTSASTNTANINTMNTSSAVTPTEQISQIGSSQQTVIHRAACEMMAAEIAGRAPSLPDPTLDGTAQVDVMGAFVTAKREGRLRGCCGALGQILPLIDALQSAAARTATQDVRLPPISPTELAHLEIGVTLLHSFVPVKAVGKQRIAAVEIGRHGLQIERGGNRGLLLPSVATENGWDAEEFLRQVSRKAGLPVTAWEDEQARLVTFEGLYFSAPFDSHVLQSVNGAPAILPASELELLRQHVRTNIMALVQGATPNYYMSGVSDGTVAGIAISMALPSAAEPLYVSQTSMRPGIPLQSSLFTLCEAAAGLLQKKVTAIGNLSELRVGVTVLHDPAMHGTVQHPDLRGFAAGQRAMMVVDRGKTAWSFYPDQPAEELLKHVIDQTKVSSPQSAGVFSFAVTSTDPSITISSVPLPLAGQELRPAAVAGTFYPADPQELTGLVDELLRNDEPVTQEEWPAVMVPHAGLKYSGRIAAEVLRRIRFPDTVIVIGPKHTRYGVEWSVAPHEKWSIPGATVASDPALAAELAEAIPGLQLDAAAHHQEHAIEVELPLIHHLAPQARVVGIAIGGGDLERCRQFATGLAQVLRRRDPRPLIVISSDMNHFATDAENRRLDEMALGALDRLDPAELYRTVTENQISMCGVLPAVITLETMLQLNSLSTAQRVAYGTSADVTGEKSRVVGYAGMLFG